MQAMVVIYVEDHAVTQFVGNVTCVMFVLVDIVIIAKNVPVVVLVHMVTAIVVEHMLQ